MLSHFSRLNADIKVILFGILLTNIGNYMLNPFLALYLNTFKGLDASQIGVVLMCSIISMQGLSFLGGIISDFVGTKKLLILGLAIRIVGYVVYLASDRLVLFIISAVLVGIGAAIYAPATKVIIYKSSGELRKEVFALRSTLTNIGASIGPILGGFLYKASFYFVFLSTIGVFIIYLCMVLIFVRDITITEEENKNDQMPLWTFKTVLKDRKFLLMTMNGIGFWFLYNQFSLTVPLYVKDVGGTSDYIGFMFTFNGLLVVILQYYLIKKTGNLLTESTILLIGTLFMSFAFLCLTAFPGIVILLLFTFLFTLSEMLVVPTIDTITGDLATERTAGSYYGFALLGAGIGGALGNLIGGATYNWLNKQNELWIFWLILATFALLISVLYKLFLSKKQLQTIVIKEDR